MWIPDAKVGGSTPPVGSFLLLGYEQWLYRTQGYGSNERKALGGTKAMSMGLVTKDETDSTPTHSSCQSHRYCDRCSCARHS